MEFQDIHYSGQIYLFQDSKAQIKSLRRSGRRMLVDDQRDIRISSKNLCHLITHRFCFRAARRRNSRGKWLTALFGRVYVLIFRFCQQSSAVDW